MEGNPHVAKCLICTGTGGNRGKIFQLSNMGRKAIQSHETAKGHVQAVKNQSSCLSITSFVTPRPAPGEVTSSEASSSETPAEIPSSPAVSLKSGTIPFKSDEDTLKAEIRWVLHTVKTHQSFRAQTGISELFKCMFPDSDIASGMKLSRTKTAYLVAFGLGPLFAAEARADLKKADYFAACFDESLNRDLKKEQMDVAVKLWDVNRNEVSTRYWSSVFLGHTTAEDLKVAFISAFDQGEKLELLPKCVQVSRDGPNVNWSFIQKLQAELRVDDDDPYLLECGSCGLHVVHGAFKTGASATEWELDSFLKNLYGMFKYSPAKCEDYVNITKSNLSPEKFCNCRWLENGGMLLFLAASYRVL